MEQDDERKFVQFQLMKVGKGNKQKKPGASSSASSGGEAQAAEPVQFCLAGFEPSDRVISIDPMQREKASMAGSTSPIEILPRSAVIEPHSFTDFEVYLRADHLGRYIYKLVGKGRYVVSESAHGPGAGVKGMLTERMANRIHDIREHLEDHEEQEVVVSSEQNAVNNLPTMVSVFVYSVSWSTP